ncbi:MAG: hypothetical protein VB142_00375 [Burkholderia sp.]
MHSVLELDFQRIDLARLQSGCNTSKGKLTPLLEFGNCYADLARNGVNGFAAPQTQDDGTFAPNSAAQAASTVALRAPSVAACATSRMFTFFNISDYSLDDSFYPKSVSRRTGAATIFVFAGVYDGHAESLTKFGTEGGFGNARQQAAASHR